MDQYFTYEARLASFQKNAKKRGSTANGRGKTFSWPHKQIAPATVCRVEAILGAFEYSEPADIHDVACQSRILLQPVPRKPR